VKADPSKEIPVKKDVGPFKFSGGLVIKLFIALKDFGTVPHHLVKS
jgi:hypothetical protein